MQIHFFLIERTDKDGTRLIAETSTDPTVNIPPTLNRRTDKILRDEVVQIGRDHEAMLGVMMAIAAGFTADEGAGENPINILGEIYYARELAGQNNS